MQEASRRLQHWRVFLCSPCYFAKWLNTHGFRRYALGAYAPLRPAMYSTAARSVRIRRALFKDLGTWSHCHHIVLKCVIVTLPLDGNVRKLFIDNFKRRILETLSKKFKERSSGTWMRRFDDMNFWRIIIKR